MAKKSGSRAIVPIKAPTRDVTHLMNGGSELVQVTAVYSVPKVHPTSPGPWAKEADKIAWTDPLTGYGCIIRRSPHGQHLCGYVSVPPDHPLFGRREGTLVGSGISVHGGIDHSAACQVWESEETSVCHVTKSIVPPGFRQSVHVNDLAKERHLDDAWWFGFSCNQLGDVSPARHPAPHVIRTLQGVHDRSYKDEAFVHRECLRLAIQLKAVEAGRDPKDYDPGPAAPSFDNRQRG